jgi:hypothetical protein
MKALFALTCLAALVGCSTASKDIVPTYASPLTYNNYDCEQLQAENLRLTARVTQLGGRLDEAASNDKSIGVVGAVLFWPALFALGGTKGQEAEYARIKGEHDALQSASIQKKCGAFTPVKQAVAEVVAPIPVAAASAP